MIKSFNLGIFISVSIFTLIGRWYVGLTIISSLLILILLCLYFFINRKIGFRFSLNPNFGKPVILYYLIKSSSLFIYKSLFLLILFLIIYILIIGWFFFEPIYKED